VVGSTGVGKTTFVKSIITNVHASNIIKYDPFNEYEKGYNIEIDNFLQLDYKNKLILVEEATSVLSFYNRIDIIKMLTRRRHNNVSSIFVFHSIRTIPVYIFDFLDGIVFFRTNDRRDIVEKKYKDIIDENLLDKITNLPHYKYIYLHLR
jgi:ABC-type cobalamin/Fe3+-siderophores transport system ATPase subunit